MIKFAENYCSIIFGLIFRLVEAAHYVEESLFDETLFDETLVDETLVDETLVD